MYRVLSEMSANTTEKTLYIHFFIRNIITHRYYSDLILKMTVELRITLGSQN